MASAEDDPSPPEAAVGPFVEQRDASVLKRWDLTARTYYRYVDGLLVEERPFTARESAEADERLVETARTQSRDQLLQQARTAYTTNRTYLDKVAAGTATTADHIAQIPALTRQMQGLIRLIVGSDLLDPTGSDGG